MWTSCWVYFWVHRLHLLMQKTKMSRIDTSWRPLRNPHLHTWSLWMRLMQRTFRDYCGPVRWFCTIGGEAHLSALRCFQTTQRKVVKSHTIICFLGLGASTCGGKTALAELRDFTVYSIDNWMSQIIYNISSLSESGLVFFSQDLIIAPTRLASAKPVWPVWAEDRGSTQSSPPSPLWNRR